MEPTNPNTDIFSTDLKIDETARRHIAGIAQWAMIVVVTAVIGYVLVLIGAFTAGPSTASSSEGFGVNLRVGGSGIGGAIFGIILGLLLNYFLYQFVQQSRKSVESMDSDLLGSGFRNLKIYFTFLTVLWIIGFLFVLVALAAIG